jgi:hypothetical protein
MLICSHLNIKCVLHSVADALHYAVGNGHAFDTGRS